MSNFIITKEQMQKLLNVLGEIPAKYSIEGINILQRLRSIPDNQIKEEETATDTTET